MKSVAVVGETYDVSLGDLDGDGTLDLVASHETPRRFSVYCGYGNGDFGSASVYDPGFVSPHVIADFTEDGRPDIVITSFDVPQVAIFVQ
jgi:hypothetical protein